MQDFHLMLQMDGLYGISKQIFGKKKILQSLFSYLRLSEGWRTGCICREAWKFCIFEWQPRALEFNAGLIESLRYSPNRAGGRTNIFFSISPISTFLARVTRTLKSLTYEKDYSSDDSWRRRVLTPELVTNTDDVRPQRDFKCLESQRDSHLAFADLAVILLGSCQNLEDLKLTTNWDPGAPSTLWMGLPPIRDCEWYILCPMQFPPLKEAPRSQKAAHAELYDTDARVPGPQACQSSRDGSSLVSLSRLYNDEHDHIDCCVHLDRSIYWTGQALRSPLRIMYGDGKAIVSAIAAPSSRPQLPFTKLKRLTLQPPQGAIYTRSCWALLCLLRGLKLTSFPVLEKLCLLGDFVLFRQQQVEDISSLEEWDRVESSRFRPKFEDTELWVRDMMNIYLCGEVPIRDIPNFSARRFTTFATKMAFVDQQKYWRAVLDTPGIWNFPNLKHLSMSGTATAGSETWQRMVIQNLLPAVSHLQTLELDRTIRSPAEALKLPFDVHTINTQKFPSLRKIIVRCVYGIETLATVQRLFTLLLGKPVFAHAQELVLTDHHRIGWEAMRLSMWTTYQAHRDISSMQGQTAQVPVVMPRAQPHCSSSQSVNRYPNVLESMESLSFFVPDQAPKLHFRFLFGGEDYDPDLVEDKLMEIAMTRITRRVSLESRSMTSEKDFMRNVDGRGTLSELDRLIDRESQEKANSSLVYFYGVERVHFDIGTYEAASKNPDLFDIVSDRLMQLRFIPDTYSQRLRSKLAEFIPIVVEEEGDTDSMENDEDRTCMNGESFDTGKSQRSMSLSTSFTELHRLSLDPDAVPAPSLKLFRAGSNDSQVLSHVGRLSLRASVPVLDDVRDVGRLSLNIAQTTDSQNAAISHIRRRHLLSSSLIFEADASEHRKLLGIPKYDWPKEEPEPTDSPVKQLKITLRYAMDIIEQTSPCFGESNQEAYRRVMLARRWICFNPTLKGCASKLLEVKTAPEKSLDQ